MSPAIAEQSDSKPKRITRDLVVLNENGLCARPTTEFVRCANAFQSSIWIVRKGKRYSANRIIDVLLANLDRGSRFTLEAEGPDAPEAVERIERLLVFLRECRSGSGDGQDELAD
jgi:phosphocarrier protein HPr